jgi:hypothetical protein
MKRYFSVEEANALVPALEAKLALVMQLRAQLRAGYQELEALGEPPSAESLARTDGDPQVVRRRGRFRAVLEALTGELQEIEALGVAIKDLDIGLCDFLAERDGRDIWLCWRYGEKRVEFWHDLDTGFAGRQPIETGERPPRTLH